MTVFICRTETPSERLPQFLSAEKPDSQEHSLWEFPGGLMVRIWCFHHGGPDSTPDLGPEIPHQATAHVVKKVKF